MNYHLDSRKKGFALPTVLIASVIMLMVLMVSLTSVAAVRTSLIGQYYNQLAQNAGDAGVSYALSCLEKSGGIPKWSNAAPLTQSTDCAGATLAACSSPCFVTSDASVNVKSTFSIGLNSNDLSPSGKLMTIRAVGTASLYTKTGNAIWRSFKQNTIYRVTIYPDVVDTNGLIVNLDAADSSSYPSAANKNILCPVPTGWTAAEYQASWTDITCNGYNGVFSGTPTYGIGNGGLVNFDGAGTELVHIGSVPEVTDVGTISFWMRSTCSYTSPANDCSYRNVMTTNYNNAVGSSTGNAAIRFELNSSGSFGATIGNDAGTISSAVFAPNASPPNGGSAIAAIQEGQWYNIVLTFDKANNGISCYINSVKTCSSSVQSQTNWTTVLVEDLALANGYGNNNTSGDNRWWKGDIASFQLYNRWLSDGEVYQNYNATKGRYF